MDKVISADGTPIAHERVGDGPAVVLVGGAFCDHTATADIAAALAGEFTAISYDRRGRGESGDREPYDVQREVEDIAALADAYGGRANLFGISSGAALCLVAAASGAPVDAVAAFEPPYRVGDAPPVPADYTETVRRLTSDGRRGEAVAYFMTAAVGQPPEAVDEARKLPMWPALEAMAHTLVYDSHCLGGEAHGIPDELSRIAVPVLGVHSHGSPSWLVEATEAVAKAVPDGMLVGLAGGFHEVPAATLAPVLTEFFARRR